MSSNLNTTKKVNFYSSSLLETTLTRLLATSLCWRNQLRLFCRNFRCLSGFFSCLFLSCGVIFFLPGPLRAGKEGFPIGTGGSSAGSTVIFLCIFKLNMKNRRRNGKLRPNKMLSSDSDGILTCSWYNAHLNHFNKVVFVLSKKSCF